MKTTQAMMITFAVLLHAQPSPAVDGEMILNGDFENHTFSPECWFNISNLTFNLGMANATAFGNVESIDVMADGNFLRLRRTAAKWSDEARDSSGKVPDYR